MIASIDDYRNSKTRSLPSIEPCSIEAEENLLGAILFDPNSYQSIQSLVGGEMFYVKAHAEIYRAIQRVAKAGNLPDMFQVSCYLQDKGKLDGVGGMVKLTHLAETTVSATNIERFAAIIAEKWARRELVHAGRDLADISRDNSWEPGDLFEFVERFYDRVKGLHQHFGGEDKQAAAYNRLVEQIRQIEQNELDPGLRTYRLAELANKTGTTTKFLSGLYHKYLSSFEIEPSMTLAELREKYGGASQEWMMHGFGPAGSVVLLHAHGGVGKTRLIYDWIYAMVRGEAWEGHNVTAPSRRVLMVQTDESQGDTLTALDQRGFEDDMPIRIMTRWTADHMAGLRKEIEEFNPEVILIDSLTSINRNSMFSENDTEYARPVLELRDLAQEFGCLIYLVHHSNSQNGSRGTKAITASVSHVFSLHRPSDGASATNPKRILCVDKSRCRAPGEYVLEFNQETGGWDFKGVNEKEGDKEDAPNDGSDVITEVVLEFLTNNRNVKYESRELEELLGYSKASVNRALSNLAHSGLICRAKKQGGSGKGKRPNVYWVSWDGSDGESNREPNEPNGESNCESNCEPNSKPYPERVLELDSLDSSDFTKTEKISESNSEKNAKLRESNEPNSESLTQSGFQFDSQLDSRSDSVSLINPVSQMSLIGEEVIAVTSDGETVGGELQELGERWGLVISKGQKYKVKAETIKQRPGTFTQTELEDMLRYEQDRLEWSTDRLQEFSLANAGDYLELLPKSKLLNVIYQLRKED